MAKTSQALQKPTDPASIIEQVITKGDLAELSPEQKVSYYNSVCQSLGLNALTKPFDFLQIEDKKTGIKKVVLYARKDCTEQLRKKDGISIFQLDQKIEDGCLIVTAHARTAEGREDVDDGVVFIKGLMGDSVANARMRAVTKAKRRVTLSICGLGFLDESEIETIPGAQRIAPPEEDAIMTEQEALTLSYKASGLDQWKCSRATAMEVIKVTAQLKAKGVDDDTMRKRLPDGVVSRKDLTEAQAKEAIKAFTHWLNTWNEVVEGEVIVNG